ncbi:MAG: OsmC family protein [Planctomycetota bacterium]|jgi:uncharacterized OsmC-like protein
MTTVQTKINGFDTDALKQTMAAISADASKGIAKFQVATHWTGGTRSETSVDAWALGGQPLPRNFKIATDEPVELLGENTAPNPQEILMSGLNACIMVGYVAGCAMHGIELEKLVIETEGELDLRGFLGLDDSVSPGYDEIRLKVHIKGNGTPEQFQEIHETVKATSPNFFNLSKPIALKPELVVE